MTADFFGATLTASSYDLEEKSDHGTEEQVEKASSGQGQAQRCQEERREKESPAGDGEDEGQGEKGRQSTQGCEEGQAPGQSRRQESRAQTEARPAKSCGTADSGTDDFAAGIAGLGGTGIDV